MTALCRIHGTAFATVDGRGRAYRSPVCYDCLEPHRESCPQLAFVLAYSLWLRWQLEIYPDTVQTPIPSDTAFWDRFDSAPDCRCPGRPLELAIRPTVDLSRVETAQTWKRLRSRLVKMLIAQTGTTAPRYWTLRLLADAAGGTPEEAWLRLSEYESGVSRDSVNKRRYDRPSGVLRSA